jgi:glycosyltransferase involved in cell wall biosynthesis
MCKVSVLIITYNQEKYISTAIDSVLSQVTNYQYEIVIGEDCSTDKTREIVLEYKSKIPDKIKLILQEKNVGPQNNFIDTLNACTGKYIALLEGDDYWSDPYKLQKQVDFLETNPDYSMISHNALIIYENNIVQPHKFNIHKLQSTLWLSDLISNWEIPTASMLFRQEVVCNLPEWFNKIYNGDYALGLIVASKGKIKYVDEEMSVYRKQFGGFSFNPKINSEFNTEQLIKLFKCFNAETNYNYNSQIQTRINELDAVNKKQKLKSKYPFLFPRYLLKKILLHYGYVVLNNQNAELKKYKLTKISKLYF